MQVLCYDKASYLLSDSMICFNCRRPGHGIDDCPEKTAGMGKHLKNRACFVCGKKDHRALECPDNPRGMYPEGGGCKFCGDVTHLYMACPKKLGFMRNRLLKNAKTLN